ncbi:MAG: hypothetical protein U5L11_12275 [Arhodomonas sp.]|nr:hypothetical protein [Arhodomonas sp.]
MWFNIPSREDWGWFKAGGGFLKGRTLHAGRFNGGEGLVLVRGPRGRRGLRHRGHSGLPEPGADPFHHADRQHHPRRGRHRLDLFFGHAYIGTVGTEGALEGMTTGYVSREWAKQHHDRWYEQVKDREQPESAVRGGERRHGESDTAT